MNGALRFPAAATESSNSDFTRARSRRSPHNGVRTWAAAAADMVVVTIIGARVLVLLAVLGRFVVPFFCCLAFLDRRVFRARVMLFLCRHDLASMICPPSRSSRFSFFPSGEKRLQPALASRPSRFIFLPCGRKALATNARHGEIAVVLQISAEEAGQLFHRVRRRQRRPIEPRAA